MKKILIPKPSKNELCSSATHFATNILPISIKELNRELFTILFFVETTKSEHFYLSTTMICEESTDKVFVTSHPKNISNLSKDNIGKMNYIHFVSDLNNDNLFGSDLEVHKEDSSYVLYGYKKLEDKSQKEIKFIIPYDLYIKIGLFFVNTIEMKNIKGESVFLDLSLMNLNTINISSIKFRSSSINPAMQSVVFSNYIAKDNKKNTYSFSYCSANIMTKDRRIKNLIGWNQYVALYDSNQIIDYRFYDNKRQILNIIYRKYNSITNALEEILVLEVPENICSETGLLNLVNLYENIKKENN